MLGRVILVGFAIGLDGAGAGPMSQGQSTAAAIEARGVRISVSVKGAVHPYDGLIQVRARVQNKASRSVLITAPDGCEPAPSVDVLNSERVVVYPPALPPMRATCGPLPAPLRLGPRRALSRTVLVVLRGRLIQGVVRVISPGSRGVGVLVRGQALRLRLAPAAAPRVRLRSAGGALFATIYPVGQPRGRLRFVDEAVCRASPTSKDSREIVQHRSWTLGSRLLTSGCSPVESWHAVAGWLDHRVAVINYR